MIGRWAALAAVAALGASGLVAACGGAGDAPGVEGQDDGGADGTASGAHACVPGQQVACACPGTTRGAQACNADGTGFGPCLGCEGSAEDGAPPGRDAASGGDDGPASGDDGPASGDDGPASGDDDASDGATASDAHETRDTGAHDAETRDVATEDAGHDAGHDAGGTDAATDAPTTCSAVGVSAARAPVFMLFALDGSGSMDTNNKWTAATAAIDAVFTDMKAKADPGLGAGLIVFADQNDPTCMLGGLPLGQCQGPYPSSIDVPIAFVDAAQLGKLTGRTPASDVPSGDTPTDAVLTGGFNELASFAPQPPLPPSGKKVMVLITDGVPTDACAPQSDAGLDDYPNNTCVQLAAQSLAKASPQGPIETFVIGVGTLPSTDFTNYDPYFLGALAVAGGTAPAACNPKENTAGAKDLCYFNVDPAGSAAATQTALEAALDAIRGQVGSCTIPIVLGSAGPLDPGNFNVELGSTMLVQSASNGWTYDNLLTPTEVILHGAACAQLTSAPTTKIEFLLGCPTIVK